MVLEAAINGRADALVTCNTTGTETQSLALRQPAIH
jgi:hypothetical protein